MLVLEQAGQPVEYLLAVSGFLAGRDHSHFQVAKLVRSLRHRSVELFTA
jgi:hypothetical protein